MGSWNLACWVLSAALARETSEVQLPTTAQSTAAPGGQCLAEVFPARAAARRIVAGNWQGAELAPGPGSKAANNLLPERPRSRLLPVSRPPRKGVTRLPASAHPSQSHFNFVRGGSPGYSSCIVATVTCSIRRPSPFFSSHGPASQNPPHPKATPTPDHCGRYPIDWGPLLLLPGLIHSLWHQACHDPAKSSARPAPENRAGLRELQAAQAEGSVTHRSSTHLRHCVSIKSPASADP